MSFNTDDHIRIAYEPFPLLSGPEDIIDGYRALNALERDFVEQSLRLHMEPTVIWYRMLGLFVEAISGKWDLTDVQHPDFGARVANLQAQLLGLGVSAAKSALDSLLAGYYSPAFASIRHMLETFVQHCYLLAEPQEYVRWYEQNDGPKRLRETPRCKEMIIRVQASPALESIGFPLDFMNDVYDSWSLMSKGSHPTGEGIIQTVDENAESRFVYGATYNRQLCVIGFDHGLFAVKNLLAAITSIRPQSEEWTQQLAILQARVSDWREKSHSELLEASEAAGNA